MSNAKDKSIKGPLPKFKTPMTKTSTKVLRPVDLILQKRPEGESP